MTKKSTDTSDMIYQLEVRCQPTSRHRTLKEAYNAGLTHPWGTPWQIHLDAPDRLGHGWLAGYHNEWGTRERALEYAATLR